MFLSRKPFGSLLKVYCHSFMQGGSPTANMEVKTSLLDNMIGVGDMVLLEPLSEDSFLENLKKRFEHNEIYVSLFIFLFLYMDEPSSKLMNACG